MKLTHACIVARDLDRLSRFYGRILQIEPQSYGDDYVEFPTEGSVLSLFTHAAQEALAAGSTEACLNRTVMMEFQVADVDQEYARLRELQIDLVKEPTTQPWGNRSIYFRDPDGNLINFYSRVSKA